MRVLVTGGAGYIGSHTLVELQGCGHQVFAIDNFCNSSNEALKRAMQISRIQLPFAAVDIRDLQALTDVLSSFKPDAIIHFAGLKSVEESNVDPLTYYDTNVLGTLRLLEAMAYVGCRRLIFSSSATVYGPPLYLPYDENHPLRPENTYGKTKLMAEQMISDWQRLTPDTSVVFLRYFNPVGAHFSGDIGEHPRGRPNNLFPLLAQVAVGLRSHLDIYGNDYQTKDGSPERDYIHVADLAKAHVAALDFLSNNISCEAFNIGVGVARSVFEVVRNFEKASGKRIPLEIKKRRDGDLPSYYADCSKANRLLSWRPELGLEEMCRSSWVWQSQNRLGYQDF